MKSYEVRIGNYVSYLGRLTQITGKDLYDDIEGRPFEGIVLTEEWLIKLGWLWNEESKTFERYPESDGRMHLRKSLNNDTYHMFNYVLQAMIAKNIYFLHELQNLFFALTGRELITKEIADHVRLRQI